MLQQCGQVWLIFVGFLPFFCVVDWCISVHPLAGVDLPKNGRVTSFISVLCFFIARWSACISVSTRKSVIGVMSFLIMESLGPFSS